MKFFKVKKSTFNFDKSSVCKALVVLFFIAALPANLVAQKKELTKHETTKKKESYGHFKYLEVIGHTGSHFYSGQTLDDALKNGYGSAEIRLGWKSGDPEHWSNKYYNSMSYGVGFYTGYIGDPDVLGNPNALYGFVDLPIGKQGTGKRTTWSFNPAFGLTYNLKAYNPSENPTNDAIGASFAVYIALAGKGHTVVTRELDISYGIDFTHFSNGRSFMPNYGLNMVGLNFGMRYHFNSDQRKLSKDPYTEQVLPARYKRVRSIKVPKESSNKINILTSIGTVQNGFEENQNGGYPSNRYFTFSGYVEYVHNFDMMHGIAAGIDLFYDESLVISHPDNRYLLGYHIGYDYTFWRITVKTQLGGYIGDDKGKNSIWARPGVQYKINNWLSAHVALKTRRGFAADWAEFGVVFHPFKW